MKFLFILTLLNASNAYAALSEQEPLLWHYKGPHALYTVKDFAEDDRHQACMDLQVSVIIRDGQFIITESADCEGFGKPYYTFTEYDLTGEKIFLNGQEVGECNLQEKTFSISFSYGGQSNTLHQRSILKVDGKSIYRYQDSTPFKSESVFEAVIALSETPML